MAQPAGATLLDVLSMWGLGDFMFSLLSTPDLVRLRGASKLARALVDECAHWDRLERALDAINSYNIMNDEPFVLATGEQGSPAPQHTGSAAQPPLSIEAITSVGDEGATFASTVWDSYEHRSSCYESHPARVDPRIQPTYAVLPPFERCRLLLPFVQLCVERLREHFSLRSAAQVASDDWMGCGNAWSLNDPGNAESAPEEAHEEALWICHGSSRVVGESVHGSKRWCLLTTLAEMDVASYDLSCESGPYWFRDDCSQAHADQYNGGVIHIDIAMGSSLRDAVAGEGTIFDHEAFGAGGRWAGMQPGSDEHILALSRPVSTEAQHLNLLCGDALGDTLDVMAEARALVPVLLAGG